MCLGKVSKDFLGDNMKKTGPYGYVFDFSVDYDNLDVDDFLDIHEYLTLFYLRGGAKMSYPSVFLKYLQSYLLNWIEIFRVWFSDCLKAVLKQMLKIVIRKALNNALSCRTSYRKKSPKIAFSFFSIIFHFLSFPCCVCY